MPNFISEDQIERALVQELQRLHGFDTLDCYTENPEGMRDGSGRAHKRDVILFCVLSNAIETKVCSVTAEWEHFFHWLRAEDEKEKIDRKAIQSAGASLESVIAGLFPRQRLLDYVENFVLYYKDTLKVVAQNHQFIGVNRACKTFLKRDELHGKQGIDIDLLLNNADVFKNVGYFDRYADTLLSKDEWRIPQSGKTWDLSKNNFDKLKEDFRRATYKNIEITDLRAFIQRKLDQMLQQNATRSDFAQRLQQIIDAYNSGSSSADNYFAELIKFTQDLQEEAERHIREGLTEDELELFDLLKKDGMTNEETQKVRLAAKSLLHRLREESPKVLVQD